MDWIPETFQPMARLKIQLGFRPLLHNVPKYSGPLL